MQTHLSPLVFASQMKMRYFLLRLGADYEKEMDFINAVGGACRDYGSGLRNEKK